MKQLRNIADYVSEKVKVANADKQFYISTDNMLPNKEGITEAVSFPENGSVTKYKKGDILVSNIRPYFKKIWYAQHDGFCSNDVLVFRPKDSNKTDSRYLYHLLAQDIFFEHMMAGANGTKMPRGNKKIIPNFSIPDNDLPTQKRIASILSAYDDLIEVNRKQIKLLEEAAERLYREWFIELHFPGHENTPIIDGLPKGWKKDKLSSLANIIMGQSPTSDNYNYEGIGLPFHQGVTTYGYRFVTDEVYTAKHSKEAESLDILFSVRAPVGRINITKNKIAIGRGLSALRHKRGLQHFLFYLLRNDFFKEDIIGNGSIYASITKDQLSSYEIIEPTDALQNKFNSVVQSWDERIIALDSQISQAQAARDLLLPRLMNGEINL